MNNKSDKRNADVELLIAYKPYILRKLKKNLYDKYPGVKRELGNFDYEWDEFKENKFGEIFNSFFICEFQRSLN